MAGMVERRREHYQKWISVPGNREKHRQWTRARRTKAVLWLHEQKNKPCADCGQMYPPCVMEFHHVRGKKSFSIGSRISANRERVMAEIAKCVLLCSNCHRIRTWRSK